MSKITLEQIRNFIELHTNLNLKKNTRQRAYVEARAVYYKLARDFTHSSLPDISRSVGLTHASVIHSLNKVFPTLHIYNKKMMELYDEFSDIQKFSDVPTEDLSALEENNILKEKLYEQRSKNKHMHDRMHAIESLMENLSDDEIDKVADKISVFVKVIEAQRHMSR